SASSGGGSATAGGAGGGSGLVELSGTITDGANGNPLAGATVEVVGAAPANSTLSDASGKFMLQVPALTTLLVRVSKSSYLTSQGPALVMADGSGGTGL